MLCVTEVEPDVLFSPESDDADSRPAAITSFVTNRRPDLVDELNAYVQTLDDSHRLFGNYHDKGLPSFDMFQIISLWRRDGAIVGFATGWDRPSFYPEGSIRLLNRTYHDPELSRVPFTRELLRPSTFHCVQHQMILADRLGYTNGFISREMRAMGFFKRFVAALDSRSTNSWEYREGPHLLAPNPADDSCWQSIGMTEFRKSNTDFWSHWNANHR